MLFSNELLGSLPSAQHCDSHGGNVAQISFQQRTCCHRHHQQHSWDPLQYSSYKYLLVTTIFYVTIFLCQHHPHHHYLFSIFIFQLFNILIYSSDHLKYCLVHSLPINVYYINYFYHFSAMSYFYFTLILYFYHQIMCISLLLCT